MVTLDHSRVSPSYSHAPYRDGTAVCLAAYGWLSTRATPLTNHMSMWARPLLLFYPISISSYWLNGLQSMLFPSTTRLARGACRTAGTRADGDDGARIKGLRCHSAKIRWDSDYPLVNVNKKLLKITMLCSWVNQRTFNGHGFNSFL